VDLFNTSSYYWSVPILDARTKKIQLPEGLKTIVEEFPRFEGRVSQDSLMLVCYTNSSYTKDSSFHISHNIIWAAVLSTVDQSVFVLSLFCFEKADLCSIR
jgi:hypothetical protein